MVLEPGFAMPAILVRADYADAFVSNRFENIEDLPHGAVVGTSSLRRQAQLRARRPDLDLRDLRGNVNTRLAKLDAGDYDAIVLACAGLSRLGFESRIRTRLDAPEWLPAPAQGAIAIECRDDTPETFALLGRARRCSHARMRRSRARDEPRAARQLPRAGRGLRAPRGGDAASAGLGGIGERWARRARGIDGIGSRSARRRSRTATARARRRRLHRRSVVERHHVLGFGEEQPAFDEGAARGRTTLRRRTRAPRPCGRTAMSAAGTGSAAPRTARARCAATCGRADGRPRTPFPSSGNWLRCADVRTPSPCVAADRSRLRAWRAAVHRRRASTSPSSPPMRSRPRSRRGRSCSTPAGRARWRWRRTAGRR